MPILRLAAFPQLRRLLACVPDGGGRGGGGHPRQRERERRPLTSVPDGGGWPSRATARMPPAGPGAEGSHRCSGRGPPAPHRPRQSSLPWPWPACAAAVARVHRCCGPRASTPNGRACEPSSSSAHRTAGGRRTSLCSRRLPSAAAPCRGRAGRASTACPPARLLAGPHPQHLRARPVSKRCCAMRARSPDAAPRPGRPRPRRRRASACLGVPSGRGPRPLACSGPAEEIRAPARGPRRPGPLCWGPGSDIPLAPSVRAGSPRRAGPPPRLTARAAAGSRPRHRAAAVVLRGAAAVPAEPEQLPRGARLHPPGAASSSPAHTHPLHQPRPRRCSGAPWGLGASPLDRALPSGSAAARRRRRRRRPPRPRPSLPSPPRLPRPQASAGRACPLSRMARNLRREIRDSLNPKP